MKKRSLRKKLFISGIIAVALIIFLVSLPPIISTLYWNNVSQRVVGLHQEEIILMLGEPERGAPPRLTSSVWLYRIRQNMYLLIFFDEGDIAVRTKIGNPLHFSG